MDRLEDHERFTELLQTHHTQLFGYLYALVHDVHDAEDLYQQTSLVLWRKFAEYQEGTSFFSWARTTARYETLNLLRGQKRRRQFDDELQTTLTGVFDELTGELLQARLEALQDCKQALTDDDRGLVDMCYGSELSFRETADRLGRSPKSIYDALGRIRNVLMKCIEKKMADRDKDS